MRFFIGSLVVGLTFLLVMSSEASTAIRNRYSFSETVGPAFEGTIVVDSKGGQNGVVKGTVANWTGTGLDLGPGGGNGSATTAYVDLPNGLISSLTGDASFEFWFTEKAYTAWARLFDFGDNLDGGVYKEITANVPIAGNGGDTYFWSVNRGGGAANSANQRFSFESDHCVGGCAPPPGGSVTIDTNVSMPRNVQHHVVVAYKHDDDGAGPNTNSRETIYMNGVQVGTILQSNGTNYHLSNLHDVNNWLGRSNYSADSSTSVVYNEFRIHTNAFTASDAANDYMLGPDRVGPLLSVDVNRVSGQVTIHNNQDIAIPMDYYRLSSPSGGLSPTGWSSFDDQENGDAVGLGWDESGGSNTYQLIEHSLTPAGEMFPAYSSRTLGAALNAAAFSPGAPLDLVFEFAGPNGFVIQAPVTTLVGDPFGDYNNDGHVNAADYTAWRNRKAGIGPPLQNDPTPGTVDNSDYLLWKANYSGGFGSGANVPEPNSLILLLCNALAVSHRALWRRRKSKAPSAAMSHIVEAG